MVKAPFFARMRTSYRVFKKIIALEGKNEGSGRTCFAPDNVKQLTSCRSFDFACKLFKSLQATLRTNGMRVATSFSVLPERSHPLEKGMAKSKGQIYSYIFGFEASGLRARANGAGSPPKLTRLKLLNYNINPANLRKSSFWQG